MTGVVLDSSAVLAVINDEPGGDAVLEVLDDAILSAVNHAEVMSKLTERGLSRERARTAVLRTGVRVIAFGIDLADRTGELRLLTRRLGLSLGDRACLALAEREKLPVITADRKWQLTDIGVQIQVIR